MNRYQTFRYTQPTTLLEAGSSFVLFPLHSLYRSLTTPWPCVWPSRLPAIGVGLLVPLLGVLLEPVESERPHAHSPSDLAPAHLGQLLADDTIIGYATAVSPMLEKEADDLRVFPFSPSAVAFALPDALMIPHSEA